MDIDATPNTPPTSPQGYTASDTTPVVPLTQPRRHETPFYESPLLVLLLAVIAVLLAGLLFFFLLVHFNILVGPTVMLTPAPVT